MRALTFAGILHDDGRFDLGHGFVVEGEPGRDDGNREVVVLGRGRRRLATTRLVLETPCAMPGNTPGAPITARLAVGLVDFPEDASSFRVIHDGKLLLQRRAPIVATEFEVDWPEPRSIGAGYQTVTWRASADGCLAALAYSNDGATWTPVSLAGTDGAISVDMDPLPGGDTCLFELIATDGFATNRLRCDPFVVAPKGWVLWILAPAPDGIIESGEVVPLAAQAYHLEERRPGLEDIHWTSSVDGALGTGARVLATLTSGRHRITATMYNVTSEVTVTVGA